jgi:uncharacterized protein YhaN
VKLLDLHLLAYGPFTDQHLDLSAGTEGLHLVFGPNEAGKSSALRALRALLYGVPERTQDDFRHGKTEMRVGGLVRGADGTELRCYRRKGRKNTLLDEKGDPITDHELARLLGGVAEPLFERLFGIDHEALVSGGQALLDEHGREAEALFGTGLGSTAVHALLETLDEEAQALFAPRASKPLINAALSRLSELDRRQREVTLPARTWDEARKAVETATGRLSQVAAELADAERRHSTLNRIRHSLPDLARREQIRERLAGLGDVPVLEDDFGQRREESLSSRRLAAQSRSKAKVRLEGLRKDATGLEVSEDLLAQADTIDELRDRLGGYHKAANDRPGLIERRATRVEQARQRFAEIRPDLSIDDIERLRPSSTVAEKPWSRRYRGRVRTEKGPPESSKRGGVSSAICHRRYPTRDCSGRSTRRGEQGIWTAPLTGRMRSSSVTKWPVSVISNRWDSGPAPWRICCGRRCLQR